MTGDKTSVVLFDMDGVLLEGHANDTAGYEAGLARTLEEYDLAASDAEWAALAGYEYDRPFVEACEDIGVDPVAFYDTRERHSERWFASRVESGTRTRYADVEALSELADHHQLGLVSNNYDAVVRAVVDNHNLPQFAFVRGRDPGVEGFRRRKPDPHYLEEALGTLGARTGVYVGDRETDVLAAERAGLNAVFLEREHNSAASLGTTPTVALSSLEKLGEYLQA